MDKITDPAPTFNLAELAASHPFWRRVREMPNGCWEWQGAHNGKKPVYSSRSGSVNARRWVHERYVGPIPAHKRFVSTCGNMNCVRPDHFVPWTPSAIFLQKVRIGAPDECWEWQGATNGGGYGSCRVNNEKDMVHRHAYRMAYGLIPDGMMVCHRCDNRICCNPSHLFLGTAQDNNDDMWAKGRGASGDAHGLRKHPGAACRGSRCHTAKVTEEQVLVIREKVAAGMLHRDVAEELGISPLNVGQIARGENWKHVGGPITHVRTAHRRRGEQQGAAKLTEDAVRRIRQLSDGGMFDAAIAPLYGVSPACIYAVTHRRSWKHVA